MSIEERVEKILKKLKLNRFHPFPFARTGFLQTVYGHYWPFLRAPKPDFFHHIPLNDGDILVAAENRPPTWKKGGRVMLLVHGAGGTYEAPYMQRMCRRLYKRDYLVLRLNLRCCGPSLGLARTPYHAGQSDDTRQVIQWISRNFPNSPVTQIGFSLGGNITLKMAGEDGSKPAGNLDSVVAISPPVDLAAAMSRLGAKDNRLLERVFVHDMINHVKQHHKFFPEFGELKVDYNDTIHEFHDKYAAPIGGFKDTSDYYQKASAAQYIPEIKIPTMILCSVDDPVVDGKAVAKIPHTSNLDVLLTQHGGHVGFLGWGTTWDEVRWCDQAVAKWLEHDK